MGVWGVTCWIQRWGRGGLCKRQTRVGPRVGMTGDDAGLAFSGTESCVAVGLHCGWYFTLTGVFFSVLGASPLHRRRHRARAHPSRQTRAMGGAPTLRRRFRQGAHPLRAPRVPAMRVAGVSPVWSARVPSPRPTRVTSPHAAARGPVRAARPWASDACRSRARDASCGSAPDAAVQCSGGVPGAAHQSVPIDGSPPAAPRCGPRAGAGGDGVHRSPVRTVMSSAPHAAPATGHGLVPCCAMSSVSRGHGAFYSSASPPASSLLRRRTAQGCTVRPPWGATDASGAGRPLAGHVSSAGARGRSARRLRRALLLWLGLWVRGEALLTMSLSLAWPCSQPKKNHLDPPPAGGHHCATLIR